MLLTLYAKFKLHRGRTHPCSLQFDKYYINVTISTSRL